MLTGVRLHICVANLRQKNIITKDFRSKVGAVLLFFCLELFSMLVTLTSASLLKHGSNPSYILKPLCKSLVTLGSLYIIVHLHLEPKT